jgi:hypothetical protein
MISKGLVSDFEFFYENANLIGDQTDLHEDDMAISTNMLIEKV